MTWRAHIDDDWMHDRIGIHLRDMWPGGYTIVNPGGDVMTTVRDPAALASADRPEPALWLLDEAAPALLAALAQHLGAVEHPAQLRKDYEAERARVDRFIAHLTTAVAS